MSSISFADFQKLEIRVGEITAVDDIEGKDKLYRLTVQIGEEAPRTIVAGIKRQYAKKDLLGRQIIVAANLEPKELGGVESNGMLLAADVDGRAVLLMPCEKVPAGTKVR